MGTFDVKSAESLRRATTSTLRTVAARYDHIILKGAYPAESIATTEAANPALQFINYEQSYALNATRVRRGARHPWLATTCTGEEIRRDVPSETPFLLGSAFTD